MPTGKDDVLSQTRGWRCIIELKEELIWRRGRCVYKQKLWSVYFLKGSCSSNQSALFKVAKVVGTNESNLGKNVYHFSANNNHEFWVTSQYSIFKYKDWDNYQLVLQETFKENEETPVSIKEFDYEFHYDDPVKIPLC